MSASGAAGLPRVLLICPHHPPEPVAGAVRLASFARELRALGHEVAVVAPAAATHQAEDGVMRVEVARRKRGAFENALYQARLRRALREGARRALEGFDAQVVVVSSPPPLAALSGADVARERGLPLVVDLRDLWPEVLVEAGVVSRWSPATLALRLVERKLLRACVAVTTVSSGKLDKLATRTSRPVVLVRNGVDAAWCEGGHEYAGGGGSVPFEVLYAGNLGRAQDIGLLASVVGEAPSSEGPPLRATIVGEGELRDEVEGLSRASGGRVELHAPESREAIRDRLAACGCAFVSLRSSALADSVPSKLLEAMARGVPVVAAVSGEAATLVVESGGGVVVEPGDGRALGGALSRLAAMTSPERRAMGSRGRDYVVSRYRREDAARTLSGLLRRVVAKEAGR